MKTLWTRFKSEVPEFWRKVRNLAITLSGMAGAGLAANQLPGVAIDGIFINVLKYVVIICAIIAFQAQLTVKDGKAS